MKSICDTLTTVIKREISMVDEFLPQLVPEAHGFVKMVGSANQMYPGMFEKSMLLDFLVGKVQLFICTSQSCSIIS